MIGRRTWAGAKIDIPAAKAFSTSPHAGSGQSIQVANAKHGWQTKCFRPADQVLQTKPCVMGVTIHNMILSWHMQYQQHASFHIWFTPFQGCWWLVHSLAWWGNKATTKLTKNHRHTDETIIKQTAKTQGFPPTCSKTWKFHLYVGCCQQLEDWHLNWV